MIQHPHIASLALVITFVALGCDDAERAAASAEVPTAEPHPAEPEPEPTYAAATWPVDLADVEIFTNGEHSTIHVYSSGGDLIAEVAGDHLEDGTYRASADFADGRFAVIIDVESAEILDMQLEQLEAEEVEYRANLISSTIGASGDPQALEGWSGCALTVLATVASCAPTGWWVPIACGVTGVAASCTCLNAATDGKTKAPCGKDKEKKK